MISKLISLLGFARFQTKIGSSVSNRSATAMTCGSQDHTMEGTGSYKFI